MRRLTAAALLLVLPGVAAACSCARWSATEAYARARHIFVGRVTETRTLPNPSRDGREIFPELVRARFSVLETLKGRPDRLRHVESGKPRGADCALPLEAGATYLFVVYEGVHVNACGSGPHDASDRHDQETLEGLRKLKRRLIAR